MGFSTRTMRPEDWAEIRHFEPSEFNSPDKMGYEFMKWLDKVRAYAGVSMDPSSDYRSPHYNAAVGGAKDSAHTDVPCDAVDIKKDPRHDDPNWNYSRYQIVTAALALGCTRIGSYANGSLHLDRTEGKRPSPRMWTIVDNPA